MSDDITFHDEIEAYCSRLSYAPGEHAEIHVSTRCERYDVTIERWGAERVERWSARDLPGRFTPPPIDADSNGCRWPVSITVPIDRDWTSGFHLVTVTAHGAERGRDVAHACFVVRAARDERHGALLVLGTNTWNAYNTWGGASLYTGGHQVSFRRPFGRGMLCRPAVERDDRKSRPTRWGEEADVEGHRFQEYRFALGFPASIGSSGWFSHERRFVEWAEAAGYEFDMCISTDLEFDASIAAGYAAIIDVGHDEYWSAGQRRAIADRVRGGATFVSMSGNTCFWQVRLSGSDDDPGAALVCHKYTAHETDPMVADGRPEMMSGMWCDPLVGQPEWALLGAGSRWGLYSRFGQATPLGSGAFTVYRHDHWMLADTGLRYGDLIGARDGVVGYETVGRPIDLDEYQLPVARAIDGISPAEISEIVALSPSSNIGMGEYPASISALSDQGDIEFIASRIFGRVDADSLARCRYGNSVMMVAQPFGAAGGEVIVIGTTDWVFGLADDATVDQVTRNVLDRATAD